MDVIDPPHYEERLTDIWDQNSFDSHLAEEMNLDTDADWTEILDNQPIILNDRMMTDAMQSPHIQSEHSYSLTLNDEMPQSPFGMPHIKLEDYSKDMENECFPVVSMTAATGQSEFPEEDVLIKQEPPSPPPRVTSPSRSATTTISSLLGAPSSPLHPQSLLKQPTIVLATRPSQLSHQAFATGSPFGLTPEQHSLYSKVSVKVEPHLSSNTSGFTLPPTPPSCNGSDSDGSLSPVHSVRRLTPPPAPHGVGTSSSNLTSSPRKAHSKVLLSVTSAKHANSSQTSLISSQPKGATGVLLLTEEEKRTLLAEGYPIPQRLPLTKAEERSLKKIRRKIKNKISAQESRRKKKEYMDALEKKVEGLASENSEYKKKMDVLEGDNKSLLTQLQHLEGLLAAVPPHKRSRNVGTQTISILSTRNSESSRALKSEPMDVTEIKGR